MDLFDLYNIAERHVNIIDPISRYKLKEIGRACLMNESTEIIDYGCGFAEPLLIWAENFGAKGLGIDIREVAIKKAQEKIDIDNLHRYVKVFHGNARDYDRKGKKYHIASCIGASFIWDNIDEALQTLKSSIKANGTIIFGETYWKSSHTPQEARNIMPSIMNEIDLYNKFGEHDLELKYMVRASEDDWARYEAQNWLGLTEWLKENKNDDRAEAVSDHLRISQKEHFQFYREYLGWAIYVLEFRVF